MPPRLLPALLVSIALATAPASAQDSGSEAPSSEAPSSEAPSSDDEFEFGATAQVERPIAATSEVDPTAAGTTVSARNRVAAGETTRALLYEVPSARVVQTGGPGSTTAVSLRGAQLSHTSVLLGDLPISGPDSGAFDLSLIPIASLEGIEVYRGGAPIELSDGAIGGVVRLMPRTEAMTGAGVALTLGSFGGYGTDAWASVAGEGVQTFTSIGMRGWRGDFPYAGNTLPLTESDDARETRDNADFIEGHGLFHARLSMAGGELTLVGVGVSQRRGVPGPGSALTPDVERTTSRGLGSIGFRRALSVGVPMRLGVAVGGGAERARFFDPYGQFGLGIQRLTDDQRTSFFARLTLAVDATEWLEFTTLINVRRDRYAPSDALARTASPAFTRVTPAAAFEPRLHGRIGGVRVELRPSVRVASTRGRVHGLRDVQSPSESSELLPTYRLAAVIAPAPWLALSASVASGRRAPSMLELFGNRGALGGNASLESESSLSIDASLVAQGRLGAVSGSLEARVFRLAIDDMITFAQQGQFVAVARNVEGAEILGFETGLRARVTSHLSLVSTVSWLDPEGEGGRDLPFRPRLTAQARPELHSGPLFSVLDDVIVHLGLVHTSSNFLDPSNFQQTEARSWLSTGVRAEALEGALSLSFTVSDIADSAGEDLLGYPLPGRRFAAMAGYRLEQW